MRHRKRGTKERAGIIRGTIAAAIKATMSPKDQLLQDRQSTSGNSGVTGWLVAKLISF